MQGKANFKRINQLKRSMWHFVWHLVAIKTVFEECSLFALPIEKPAYIHPSRWWRLAHYHDNMKNNIFHTYFLLFLNSILIELRFLSLRKILERDLRVIGVDKRSNFWWCNGNSVRYLQGKKHLCCRSKDGAGIPRRGPKVSFPLSTPNKFQSFFTEFPDILIADFVFFNWRHS